MGTLGQGGAREAGLALGGGAGLLPTLVSRGATAEDLEVEVEAIEGDEDDDEGVTRTGAEGQAGGQSRSVSGFLTGTHVLTITVHTKPRGPVTDQWRIRTLIENPPGEPDSS